MRQHPRARWRPTDRPTVLAEDMPRGVPGTCVALIRDLECERSHGLSRECTASESLPGRPAVSLAKSARFDVKRPGADGLIVDENLGGVVATWKAAWTLKPEVGRRGLVVGDLLLWFIDHVLTVLPADADCPRAGTSCEDR